MYASCIKVILAPWICSSRFRKRRWGAGAWPNPVEQWLPSPNLINWSFEPKEHNLLHNFYKFFKIRIAHVAVKKAKLFPRLDAYGAESLFFCMLLHAHHWCNESQVRAPPRWFHLFGRWRAAQGSLEALSSQRNRCVPQSLQGKSFGFGSLF